MSVGISEVGSIVGYDGGLKVREDGVSNTNCIADDSTTKSAVVCVCVCVCVCVRERERERERGERERERE